MSVKNDSLQQEPKSDLGFGQNVVGNQDKWERRMREKFSDLEDYSRRPLRPNEKCEHQLFAYMLCSHNRSQKFAHVNCKEEYEDYAECFRGKKKMERHETLRRSSEKIGDIVPGLYSGWRH